MARSLTPVDAIAAMVCDELGDNTRKHKFRIMKYIALGYQKMYLFLDTDTKFCSQVFDTSTKVQALPKNFVYETKVGLRHNKRICMLHMNTNKQRSFRNIKDTEMLDEVSDVLYGDGFREEYCFYNTFDCGGDYLGEVYGAGDGFFAGGFYDINKKGGYISIGSKVPEGTELIVEYKSDGISEGLELVPSEMFLALRYFAKAEFLGEPDRGPNRTLWMDEYGTLKRLYTFKPISILAGIFKSNHQSAPR